MDDETLLLEALHEAHSPALRRYLLGLGADVSLAEDIVQETLVRAWRNPEVLDETTGSARGWLFTVARHLLIDHHRSTRSRHEQPTAQAPERSVSDASEQLLDRWLITDAMAALSTEHREVVVRAYYGGASIAQLATDLGIAPGTVKSRLHYGLRALRLALQEKGVTR